MGNIRDMSQTHNKIIASAGKDQLWPLGFRQKGRSRLWLADHGSWLNVVEFTPNRWTKGISLMNAAHWLWAGTGFMAFHFAQPSKCHADFETEDQFKSAATEIAREAAMTAAEIEDRFSTFEAVTEFVVERARESDRMRPSWWGYHAGIASGLSDRVEDAERFLRGITDERVTPHAKPFLSLINNPKDFRREVDVLP